MSQVAEEAGRQDQKEQTGGDEGHFVLYKEGQSWSNRSKCMWLITIETSHPTMTTVVQVSPSGLCCTSECRAS